jgi:hypothetical protein
MGAAIDTALVVTVPVPTNVNTLLADHVVVADKVILPLIINVPVDDSVHVAPVVFNSPEKIGPDSVTVGEPEFASITAVSNAPGAANPPAPPEELDQFVELVTSQVPLPPTQ